MNWEGEKPRKTQKRSPSLLSPTPILCPPLSLVLCISCFLTLQCYATTAPCSIHPCVRAWAAATTTNAEIHQRPFKLQTDGDSLFLSRRHPAAMEGAKQRQSQVE